MVEELDLEQIGAKELNRRLQALASQGLQSNTPPKVRLRNPHASHNIAVNVSGTLDIVVEGGAGFYCCGFMNGPTVTVRDDVGWYAADNMLGGRLTVLNNAGRNLAASMIGGTVIVCGSAGSRVGYGLKGGTVVVCGEAGLFTGQQMLGGRIVLLDKVGQEAGESMVGGSIFYRKGSLAGMGNNVRRRPINPAEAESLAVLFIENDLQADPGEFECLVPKGGQPKSQFAQPRPVVREEAAS